jgi:hypothetical protein
MLGDNNPGGRESGSSSLERLALFCTGVGFGGCVLCFMLGFYLFPRRPPLPEPALGYTYLFKINSHTVYGTWFEYFAMTYGFFIAWAFGSSSPCLPALGELTSGPGFIIGRPSQPR